MTITRCNWNDLGADERTRSAAERLLDNLLDYGLRRHRAGRDRHATPDPAFRPPAPRPVTAPSRMIVSPCAMA